MAEQTPLPWKVGYESKTIIHEVPGMADGCEYFNVAVLSRHSLMSKEAADANAALIVRAVNSHDALVGALKLCIDLMTIMGRVYNASDAPALELTLEKARAALTSEQEK